MLFSSSVHGIPCQVNVTCFIAPTPMIVFGGGMGDCHPPDPGQIEYEILDRKGYPAPWLAKYLTDEDDQRIQEEMNAAYTAEKYDIAF